MKVIDNRSKPNIIKFGDLKVGQYFCCEDKPDIILRKRNLAIRQPKYVDPDEVEVITFHHLNYLNHMYAYPEPEQSFTTNASSILEDDLDFFIKDWVCVIPVNVTVTVEE